LICAVKICIVWDCQRATTSYIGVHQGREYARGRRCRHKRVRAVHDHLFARFGQPGLVGTLDAFTFVHNFTLSPPVYHHCVIVLFTRPQLKYPLLHLTYCNYRIRTSTQIHHFLGATSSETHDFHLFLVLLIIINTQLFFHRISRINLLTQHRNPSLVREGSAGCPSTISPCPQTATSVSLCDSLNILKPRRGRLTFYSGPNERSISDPDI
jgi:hypothetical protein